MKAAETPDEKRARRLAKKAAKAAKREAAANGGGGGGDGGYTNTLNPFGDTSLADKFVWGKKREHNRKLGITEEEERRLDAERRRAHQDEVLALCVCLRVCFAGGRGSPWWVGAQLEALKRARLEREREQAERGDEVDRTQADKEESHHAAWLAMEGQFHLDQARLRSQIRIRDGRAKVGRE